MNAFLYTYAYIDNMYNLTNFTCSSLLAHTIRRNPRGALGACSRCGIISNLIRIHPKYFERSSVHNCPLRCYWRSSTSVCSVFLKIQPSIFLSVKNTRKNIFISYNLWNRINICGNILRDLCFKCFQSVLKGKKNT